jgi:hypothetical protein
VVPAEPDFTATTPNDRLTLVPRKPLDVPITIAKLNGFDGDIDMKAEGLPPGIEMDVAPRLAKHDPKTVTLRFTADPITWSGLVRLVGSPKGKAGPTHIVRAPNADFERPTGDLWLTVRAEAKPAGEDEPRKK